MAKSSTLLVFLIAIQTISSSMTLPTNDHRGLTIKLVHRDSPESPLYRPDLTETQRTRDLILQSEARSIYLFGHDDSNCTEQSFETDALRFKVESYLKTMFLAEVSIGTFGGQNSTISYFLHVDTGCTLTWTQCEGCRSRGHHCFNQSQTIFPDSRSQSYRRLPCNRHPLCIPNKCEDGFCTYDIRYVDNSSTRGFLAHETFRFGSTEAVPIVFGCGVDQHNIEYGPQGTVAGIIGLGWGPLSLLAQLGPRTQNRFSHCFPPASQDANATSYLQFGSDILYPRFIRSTDLIRVGDFQPYYVELIDLSVAGRRLRIPESCFSRRRMFRRSGTVFDSGASFSTVVQPAYDVLERAVEAYLAARVPGLTKLHVPNFFKLCYRRPEGSMEGFSGLPSMTFHFRRGADMVVQADGVFFQGGADREYSFCLAMKSSNYDAFNGGFTSVGAYQQTNQRVIYDVGIRMLHFAPEDCSTNG